MNLIMRQPDARELDWIRFQWQSDVERQLLVDRVQIDQVKAGRMRLDADIFKQAVRDVIPKILETPTMSVLVAALSSIPDEAIGWIVWRPHELVYIRVGGEVRRHGIATTMFEATGLELDCRKAFMTAQGRRWLSAMEAKHEHGTAA